MKKKPTASTASASVSTKAATAELSGIYALLDKHFAANYNRYTWFFTLFTLLMALGMFQGKMSIGNDDAMYLVAGNRMGHDIVNNPYTFNAPLYIMVLALLTSVFGLNVLLMKLFSLLCFVGSVPLFFKAFKDKVPPTLVMAGMLLFSTNWLLLEYASYTYTESFFILLFAWLFFRYARHLDLEKSEPFGRKIILSLLLLAFITLFLSTTRNVAAVLVILLVFLFFVRKKFKEGLVYGLAYGVFIGLRELIFGLIWDGGLNQYKGQGSRILYKDYYNDAAGKEDLAGLFERFQVNSQYYTERFLETLGFIEPYSTLKQGVYGAAAFILGALLLAGLYMALRRKNLMLQFTAFFTLAMLGASFVALQTSWAQHRLIAVYTPLIAITCLYFMYELTRRSKVNFMQVFVLLFVVIIAGSSFISSIKDVSSNIPEAVANLKGDKYRGYTPDWVNFLKASEWCAQNLPKDALVASRKEPMSYIYSGGHTFFPVYRIPSDTLTGKALQDADQLVAYFRNIPTGAYKGKQVDYFILAELRLDLKRKIPGRFINTVHNSLFPIEQKYPGCLVKMHEEGRDEKATVVKLDYNLIDKLRQQQNNTANVSAQ